MAAIEVDQYLREIRVAVLSALARRRGLYVDAPRLRRLVVTEPDLAVWEWILRSNAGLLGWWRRRFCGRQNPVEP